MAIMNRKPCMITEDILAMARPSTSLVIQKNVIQQFHRLGIKSIINLQCPGEHSSCGKPLEDSGFTYDPSVFMKNDIYYYNFAWEDYGDIGLSALINMVKVLAFAITEGRVAIHCHAGLGRTGVLIASYLVYSLRVNANEAIKYVRLKRPGSVQTRGQIISVRHFAQFILPLTVTFHVRESIIKEKYMNPFTVQRYLYRQKIVLHGYQERKFKYFPMIIHIICERILQLCNRKTLEFDSLENHLTINFLCERNNENIKRHESIFSVKSALTDSELSSSVSSNEMFDINNDLPAGASCSETEKENDTPKHSVSFNDFTSLDENSAELLPIDKIFEETHKQILENEVVESFLTTDEIVESLLMDFSKTSEEFKSYVVKVKKYVNSYQHGYCRIVHEIDPKVLACLLFDWLEDLKSPILNQDELEKIVINYCQPEKCLKLLAMEHGFIIEYLLRFIKKVYPLNDDIQKKIFKRITAALGHQAVSFDDKILPAEKGFRKMRDGTLNCILQLYESLLDIIAT
ncbi:protein tyrosine phosphatase domain-containing protein 1 isoform X1 [Agrilus planipennis]|uniref:Protein tyrosine phosphatase domain-containing protein 1 n=1 Tax=Agrilus planipennis TaxID=224129 RepID=A0A7F5RNA2_AGRPL|nr:protein tyrosine phosphatase domain-containing protein 1 isoform X1 [Agrilus planipennis]XP_025837411.1 protein tyrosine phosphatase domain-containing protein 1 isoform X1 [Agrilus planipennis]XP_025837412.1 protein tyrosine phosphatase domain-containing protein 1 isoform X1 [Agrilus planipennis]